MVVTGAIEFLPRDSIQLALSEEIGCNKTRIFPEDEGDCSFSFLAEQT